jgi:hypothetical protein
MKTCAEQPGALHDPGGKPVLVAKEYLVTSCNAHDVWWQPIDVDSGVLWAGYVCAAPTLCWDGDYERE